MLRAYQTRFLDWVWQQGLEQKAIFERVTVRLLRMIIAVGRDLVEGHLNLRAMSLVYTTVISLVPLLAISFSVLKGLGIHHEIEPTLQNLLAPLGEKRFEITRNIIAFVDNIQVGLLSTVGLVLLIYTVIAMMQKVEKSFNFIWHISRGRSFAQRFSEYLSVLLVGPVLIFISAGMTASVHSSYVVAQISHLPGAVWVLALIGKIIPYLIMAGAFAFIYVFVPNTKVKISAAFLGGLITALIWKIMGWGFTVFVVSSGSHEAIYSVFATIILFMLWIYLGWLMLLIGSTIAFYTQYPQSMRMARGNAALSPRVKEKIALAVAMFIAREFSQKGGGVKVGDMVTQLKAPRRSVEDVLEALKIHHILAVVESDRVAYIPARPLEKISFFDVIAAVRADGEDSLYQSHDMKYRKEVQSASQLIETALEKSLKKKNLAEI